MTPPRDPLARRLARGRWQSLKRRETGSMMDTRQTQFGKEDILACARGELFGPGNAQLPLPPMLMFDRITDIREDGGPHGKGMVRAELDIRPDLWFFGCHFIGDPVMPGCLGLDALWQLTGFYLGWLGEPGRGRALGAGGGLAAGADLPALGDRLRGAGSDRPRTAPARPATNVAGAR